CGSDTLTRAALQQFVEEIEMTPRNDRPRVSAPDSLDSSRRVLSSKRWIIDHFSDRERQFGRIMFAHNFSCIANDRRYLAAIRCDHRNSTSERFDQHPAEYFAPCRR